MLHGAQSRSAATISSASAPAPAPAPAPASESAADQASRRQLRKRKAESQDNERLSKRLSLLNLEQNGSKLYVPVETPSHDAAGAVPLAVAAASNGDDMMQVEDSKHKVYIYNIDDELSSDSEADPDDGRLVFLPDIQKHLRANRIPPSVLANSDGELAGMQLVLYSDPASLSVPEDRDSVRKAIIESRQRTREQQRLEREGVAEPKQNMMSEVPTAATMTTPNDVTPLQAGADMVVEDDDADAMDVD